MGLFAFDGTWNSATLGDGAAQADETNVARFCEAYRGDFWYVPGPGTRFGRVGKVLGGLAGAGGKQRVRRAYDELCKDWANGDHVIDVVGFSRGAALALDFVNRIRELGVRRPGSKQVLAEDPPVRFLGVWDVVGSFGIPIDVGHADFHDVNLGYVLDLAPNVEQCYHAIALDERRQTFEVTRVPRGYEVWFRGVHSDVGGGNGNVGLSSIPLRWMLRKASAAGLPVDEASIAACDGLVRADAPLRLPKDFVANAYRRVDARDRVHHTVARRDDHHNPPDACPRETAQDEPRAVRIGL